MFDPKAGGPHLGCVRNWIQRKARNGEQVSWGSNERLEMLYELTPKLLEDLACDIAQAVVNDLITSEKLDEVWIEAGRPPIELDAAGMFVKLRLDGVKTGDYLSLKPALRRLYHLLLL